MKKLMIASVLWSVASLSHGAVYSVTKYTDDGSAGTLRWAIQQSNASPGGNTIQILPIALGPYVIMLNSVLPPIIGPAIVKGMQKGTSTATGPTMAIDGSNFIDGDNQNSCPGTTGGFGPNVRSVFGAGLSVVDSGNVQITNLEIRNFCIGILSLRSHDNHFDHNVVHNTSGAAGIELTGDAGDTAGSSTSGLSTNNLVEYNTIYETGDGMECTRGTNNSTFRFNTMYELRDRPNVPYSQGIECAGNGDDRIYIIGNSITGYSDGLQLNAATNLVVSGNTITGTTYGITASGTGEFVGNTITGNRMGVGPSGTASHITISQNKIYNNGQPLLSLSGSAGGTTNPASPALLGIDFGVNGVTANDGAASCADGFPDCIAPQNFPVLASTSTWNSSGTVTLNGILSSRPSAIFKIEFFANHALNPAGFAEGEVYLGSVSVTTDATGAATFSLTSTTNPLGDGTASAYFTTTATNTAGSTSEFSQPIQLHN